MKYYDALNGYLNAYNAKAKLESSPLMETGVIGEEVKKLQGSILIEMVQSYDQVTNEIENVLPQQIQDQQAIMDRHAPVILEFFGLNSGQITDVKMSTGQRIVVNEGVIDVLPAVVS